MKTQHHFKIQKTSDATSKKMEWVRMSLSLCTERWRFILSQIGGWGSLAVRRKGDLAVHRQQYFVYMIFDDPLENSSPSQGYAQSGLTCKHVALRNKTSGSSIGCWTCHHLKKNRAAPSAISIEYLSIKKFWHITSWCTIRNDWDTGTASKEQLVRLFTRLLKAVHVIDWSPWVADWWSNTNM
jgi:hypothetical protein